MGLVSVFWSDVHAGRVCYVSDSKYDSNRNRPDSGLEDDLDRSIDLFCGNGGRCTAPCKKVEEERQIKDR